jgi:excisionase family DNA binding protein
MLSVSSRTMWRLMHDGKLKALQVGGRRLIRVADLEQLLRENTTAP